MNRLELQELARIRLREARHLLRHRFYDGAYYLSGYAVECGLKACVAKQTKRHDFPDKDRAVKSYTHDLLQLVKLA
jgi:HEPN domain-containing protein